MVRIHTISDYNNAPWQSTTSRTCPGMRSIWPFKWSTYNPFHRTSFNDRMRRICMVTTLAIRTALDLYALYILMRRLAWMDFVLTFGMDAVAFVFIGWCLSVIGEADGGRIVLGVRVVRHCSSALQCSAKNRLT
jgi:hypothetical protein